MALLLADAAGRIVHFALTAEAERLLPPPVLPEPPAATLRLDDAANAALLGRLNADSTRFHLAADGALTEGGVPVDYTPARPPPPAVDPAAIGAALAALPADQPLTKADLAPLLALFGVDAG